MRLPPQLQNIIRKIRNYFSIVAIVGNAELNNGSTNTERLVHSMPGSPHDRHPSTFDVIGSAESLVGRVRLSMNAFIKI